jgi:hypothetical protein
MFYNTLVVVLAITMGFILHDLYTVLENQEEIYSAIHTLRGSVDKHSLNTK